MANVSLSNLSRSNIEGQVREYLNAYREAELFRVLDWETVWQEDLEPALQAQYTAEHEWEARRGINQPAVFRPDGGGVITARVYLKSVLGDLWVGDGRLSTPLPGGAERRAVRVLIGFEDDLYYKVLHRVLANRSQDAIIKAATNYINRFLGARRTLGQVERDWPLLVKLAPKHMQAKLRKTKAAARGEPIRNPITTITQEQCTLLLATGVMLHK